jgi:hypothetical protein
VIELSAAEYTFVRISWPFAEKVWFVNTTTPCPSHNCPHLGVCQRRLFKVGARILGFYRNPQHVLPRKSEKSEKVGRLSQNVRFERNFCRLLFGTW